jgi:AraC-like DNA-binding protein
MSTYAMLSIFSPPMPYYMEIGKTTYQPGEKHPNRKQLGVFDILFVVKGCLFVGEEDQAWAVLAGQILILLPDRYHYAAKACEEETDFYWIHFQTAGTWQETPSAGTMINAVHPLQEQDHSLNGGLYNISVPKYGALPVMEQIYTYLQQLLELSSQSRSNSFWLQQQLFVELLKTLDERQKANYSTPASAVTDKVEACIKRNYQKEVTNGSLSEELHFHPNYIVRCMKAIYGCTPMEYLVNYRLEQAKLLLLKTDGSIAHIAEEVGFHYTPYFSRCFKERQGISPLQYRKQYAK